MNYQEDSFHKLFMQIWKYNFVRCHSLIEKTGLHPGQPPLLFVLYKKNGQSQREIADRLNVKAATINVMIKRMEKTKLIERRDDEKDQRVSRIFITDEGKKICEELKKTYVQMEKESLENLTDEEKIILRRLLMQVRDNIHRKME